MNYTSIRDNLVAKMLRKYGKAVALRRPGTTAGWTKTWDGVLGRYQWTHSADPVSTVYVDPATIPVDYAGYAIEKQYKQTEIDGTTVMANDRRFLTIDVPSPTTADKLVVNGSVLTIVNVSAIQPGEITLVRILQCRGV
jgi:hypothetical protein